MFNAPFPVVNLFWPLKGWLRIDHGLLLLTNFREWLLRVLRHLFFHVVGHVQAQFLFCLVYGRADGRAASVGHCFGVVYWWAYLGWLDLCSLMSRALQCVLSELNPMTSCRHNCTYALCILNIVNDLSLLALSLHLLNNNTARLLDLRLPSVIPWVNLSIL